jgi:hypothetical protein
MDFWVLKMKFTFVVLRAFKLLWHVTCDIVKEFKKCRVKNGSKVCDSCELLTVYNIFFNSSDDDDALNGKKRLKMMLRWCNFLSSKSQVACWCWTMLRRKWRVAEVNNFLTHTIATRILCCCCVSHKTLFRHSQYNIPLPTDAIVSRKKTKKMKKRRWKKKEVKWNFFSLLMFVPHISWESL